MSMRVVLLGLLLRTWGVSRSHELSSVVLSWGWSWRGRRVVVSSSFS
ncbi:hypothetical protein LINPERHAP2_LOCUS40122 [Linum perenne]